MCEFSHRFGLFKMWIGWFCLRFEVTVLFWHIVCFPGEWVHHSHCLWLWPEAGYCTPNTSTSRVRNRPPSPGGKKRFRPRSLPHWEQSVRPVSVVGCQPMGWSPEGESKGDFLVFQPAKSTVMEDRTWKFLWNVKIWWSAGNLMLEHFSLSSTAHCCWLFFA